MRNANDASPTYTDAGLTSPKTKSGNAVRTGQLHGWNAHEQACMLAARLDQRCHTQRPKALAE